MTGLMMKDALVMRKTLRLYALFLLFYSGLAVLGVFPMSMALAMVMPSLSANFSQSSGVMSPVIALEPK